MAGTPARMPAIWPGYWPERLDPARMPDHWPFGQDPGRIWPSGRDTGRVRPESGKNGRTPGIWSDPAALAESPTSWPLARTAGFRSTGRDPTVLCRIPAKIIGIRQKWPDSGNFCRNLYMPNIYKKKIILFYINIFYFVHKILFF
jgi:hypothetical protein